MKPIDHIAQIRVDKFGPNNPLARDLQKAIENLSVGLYSKDVHFILELIQNAEDNAYPTGVTPELTFVLLDTDPTQTPGTRGALLVVNNESGLLPENVEALCAVGDSTKDKPSGYIGEKGIGFKSVFTVSCCPHLFSNGYQFRFCDQPDADNSLGYIVPAWVNVLPEAIVPFASRTTCILLPLRQEKQEAVAQGLEHIAPETILFLEKLRELHIKRGGNDVLHVVRDDTHLPLVSFITEHDASEFWVGQKSFDVPPTMNEEKRLGVTTRTVSVAFPLKITGDRKPKHVFAFLPLEMDSGLPFLVNADFLVTAARESIQTDRDWNKWLRTCTALVWLQAFEQGLQSPDHRLAMYAFIPDDTEAYERFFRPVSTALLNFLKDRQAVWTLDNKLEKPTASRLASKEFRTLIGTGARPTQLQQTPLVHAELEQYSRQLKAIGVKDLSASEVIACLNDTVWLKRKGPSWFADLYRFLRNQKWATAELLKSVRLVLLESGELTSPDGDAIYLPAGDDFSIVRDHSNWSEIASIGFLSSKVYTQIKDDQGIDDWFCDVLGIYSFSAENYCVDLVSGAAENIPSLSLATLLELTVFIRDHVTAEDKNLADHVREHLPLITADERIIMPKAWDDAHPLVVPLAWNRKSGWQHIFSNNEDRDHLTVVSDYYLSSNSAAERDKWGSFFGLLGVTDRPAPKRRTWPLKYPETQGLTPAAKRFLASGTQPTGTSPAISEPEVFQWLTQWPSLSEKERSRICSSLLFWLKRWLLVQERFAGAMEGRYTYQWRANRNTVYEQKVSFASELPYLLANTPWLATTKGFVKPSRVFLKKPETVEFFTNRVPYPLEEIGEDVAKWLTIHVSATIEDVFDLLKQLATDPADKADPILIGRIYRFISERWNPDHEQLFVENSLILVNQPNPKWVRTPDVVWPDVSAVFGDMYVYLSTHDEYQELHGFFVDKLGVQAEIDPELYANAWLRIQDKGESPTLIEKALTSIYPVILQTADAYPHPEWWRQFVRKAHIWADSRQFLPPDQVYKPDDGALRTIFQGRGVPFTWLPRNASIADYVKLFDELGARSLAEDAVVIPDLPKGSLQNDSTVDQLLTNSAKLAVCHFLRSGRKQEYEHLKEQGALGLFLRTRETTVDHLRIIYELNDVSVPLDDGIAYWDRKAARLFKSRAALPERVSLEVPSLIAPLLLATHPRELENFLGRILNVSEAGVRLLIQKNNWKLSDDELAWISQILELPPLPRRDEPEMGDEEEFEDDSEEQTSETSAATGQQLTSVDAVKGILGDSSAPSKPPAQSSETPEGSASHDSGSQHGHRPPKPGKPRSASKVSRTERRASGLVFVEATNPEHTSDSSLTQRRKVVEQAAVDKVYLLEKERIKEFPAIKGFLDSNKLPEIMPPGNRGYDIESINQDGSKRYIEVKGLSHQWDSQNPARLTAPELEKAQIEGVNYWLYIVEFATTDDFVIYEFQNPVSKVERYCLEYGWAELATARYVRRLQT